MTTYMKIGIFFSLATVLIVVYMLKTAGSMATYDTYTLYVRFEDASGIIPESKVLMSGVMIGRVIDITIEDNVAVAELRLKSKVSVYQDAVAEKKTESVLGSSLIHIKPGREEPELKDGEYIKNVHTHTGMDIMMDKGRSAAERIDRLIENINTVFEKYVHNEDIDATVKSVARLTRDNAERLERNMKYIEYTLRNLAQITGKINRRSESEMERFALLVDKTTEMAERMNRLLEENNENVSESLTAIRDSLKAVTRELENSRQTIRNMESISSDVSDVTGKISRGEGSVGKILEDEKLYEDLKNITDKLSDYADSTLGMQVDVDFRMEYLPVNRTYKTHADLTLMPRKDRFYTIGIVDKPDGKTTQTTTSRRITFEDESGVREYNIVEEKEKRTDDVKFNLLIGRRFGPFSIKGGLIESEGGGGVDYSPLDYFSVSSEIFDFSKDKAPNLRIYSSFEPLFWTMEPFSWIYINAGTHDVLKDERDFFFGAGVHFTDNDLKSIIGSVPASP
ncbi:MAG: MlaD family protein [bacterium]